MSLIKGGYIIQPRCIQESWISHAAPVVRETWLYLLRRANHKDKKYDGFVVKRGQVFLSFNDIRDALKWSKGCATERYTVNQMKHTMKLLRTHLMIELSSQPRGNLITICKYDFYQNPKNYESTSESTNESTSGQPVVNQTSPAINKNDNNEKNDELKDIPILVGDETVFPSPEEPFYKTKKGRLLKGEKLTAFNAFWKSYGYGQGKAAAGDSFLDVYSPAVFPEMLAGAKRECENRPAVLKKGRTPKYAQGWLTERRWEDEIDIKGGTSGKTEERDTEFREMFRAVEDAGNIV